VRAVRSGARAKAKAGIRKTSETESTTMPKRFVPISVTTIRVFFVRSARSIPNRVRKSMIGMRRPRKLITPS
jgi:hypothetical protein